MSKFHVNGKGEAGKCSAEKGGCPFGGESEHYTSAQAARTAYENDMGTDQLLTKISSESEKSQTVNWSYEGNDFSSVPLTADEAKARVAELASEGIVAKIQHTKKITPQETAPDAHLKEAEQILLEVEPSMIERDQRQVNGTLRHQLSAIGLSGDELRRRSEAVIANGMAGIGEKLGNSEGSDRVIGLSYAPRRGESAAIEEIGEALAVGDYKAGDVQVFESRGVTFLAVKTPFAKGWGKNSKAVQASAKAAYEHIQRPAHGDNKAGGSFAGGDALVVATNNPIEAKLLHKLKEAHNAGALRVGKKASSDSLFYDDRDISREHKTREIYQAVTEKYANKKIEDLKNRMAEKDPNSYIGYLKDDYAYGIGVTQNINDAHYNVIYQGAEHTDRIVGSFTKDEAERVLNGDGLYILNNRRERSYR